MRINSLTASFVSASKGKKQDKILSSQLLPERSLPSAGTEFVKAICFNQYQPKAISFMGHPVYILDGGVHASNMEHFANAVSDKMDTQILPVATNPRDGSIKQLPSLKMELEKLGQKDFTGDEYVAVPALAVVPILNLQDQYNRVMNENRVFTPENLKANKADILRFLKKIYDSPQYYSEYIGYMDPNKQGIEYAYGVIQGINKLIKKGAKVYIPTGHPQDETIKWMAGQRGLKPELYKFIATGIDTDGKIQKLHKEIKENNWYDFNLLALSDANIVGVKGAKGAQDYMFAAYDSCVTDGARGVYNFTPIREQGKVVGYSYTDKTTNQYPYEEFPENYKVENLNKFVGKKLEHVLADFSEIQQLKRLKEKNMSTLDAPDKLYPVKEIFSPSEREVYKIDMQGRYVDRTLKLFFDKNADSEVVFSKCDCEGSGKPSVMSMWGSCFAVFNAIARDIYLQDSNLDFHDEKLHLEKIDSLLRKGATAFNANDFVNSDSYFSQAIQEDKSFALKNSGYFPSYEPYMRLGESYLKRSMLDKAEACFNTAIDFAAKDIILRRKTNIKDIRYYFNLYFDTQMRSKIYDQAMMEYNSKSEKEKKESSRPLMPLYYNQYEQFAHRIPEQFAIRHIADMFYILSRICKEKRELYPSDVCALASEDFRREKPRAQAVLELRAQGIQFIGDLYNEVDPD